MLCVECLLVEMKMDGILKTVREKKIKLAICLYPFKVEICHANFRVSEQNLKNQQFVLFADTMK